VTFLPSQRLRILVGLLLCVLLVLAFVGARAYLDSPRRGLPYRDSFAKGNADEWKAFGGAWELADGVMRNNSDERGAKLLTGSPYWRDYSIEADIKLLDSSGDAGLVIRSSDEEEGVDAYSGYYAGIRTQDNSLALGRAGHGWAEVSQLNATPRGIRPFQWYHLRLLAYGCQIVATAAASSQAIPTSIAITDRDCISSGRVGLRSYSSGGFWRNVVVRPTTHQDLVDATADASRRESPEAENPNTDDSEFLGLHNSFQRGEAHIRSNVNVQSIGSLRLASVAKPTTATVRGVVILTSPVLFVQDSTGGIYIPQAEAPPLKVGDEVEVSGEVHPGDFSSTLEHATVQLLWARTPMPAVSVTASQASTGKFDATFVEVQGRLRAKERGPDNTLILDLDEGSQSFRAIVNRGRGDLLAKLKPNSVLRLRGVCAVDLAFTGSLTPFVLLLRTTEDVQVLAGPPWWSARNIIAIAVAVILLALIANFFYHRAEHWRLRAVLEERGRLAHEIHDTLAQSFAGIGFQLQAIRNRLPEEIPIVHQQLDLASDLVRHSHEEARRSIATLRPESLESEDLLFALERCARHMVEGGAVQVISARDGDLRPMPLRITDTLYRIGQEAIANAVRHANPKTLSIRLMYDKNVACLLIEDDGTGFIQGGDLRGFGVRGMRNRAHSISASFQIQSALGEGTRIRIAAPLPPRVTLTTWPKFLWKRFREHRIHAQRTRNSDSHSYR
jgi:signal transduction histidine kinase